MRSPRAEIKIAASIVFECERNFFLTPCNITLETRIVFTSDFIGMCANNQQPIWNVCRGWEPVPVTNGSWKCHNVTDMITDFSCKNDYMYKYLNKSTRKCLSCVLVRLIGFPHCHCAVHCSLSHMQWVNAAGFQLRLEVWCIPHWPPAVLTVGNPTHLNTSKGKRCLSAQADLISTLSDLHCSYNMMSFQNTESLNEHKSI